MKEKTFRDLLSREIKIGDKVLHLWCVVNNNGEVQNGRAAVKHKHAYVVNMTDKTIRIEWRNEDGDITQSSIKNTRNRIIILTGDSNLIERTERKVQIEVQEKLIDKLYQKIARKDIAIKKVEDTNIEMHEKYLNDKIELKKTINELEQDVSELSVGIERFTILDM